MTVYREVSEARHGRQHEATGYRIPIQKLGYLTIYIDLFRRKPAQTMW